MSKVTLNLAASLAAIGLALAPAAANAKTRASDSQARYTPAQSQPGEGRAAKGEKLASGADLLAAVLVGLWATGIIVVVADVGDNDNQSPGAN